MPGGQAGTSPLIRNYLGFPHGLTGEELTNRATEQAWLFGANIVITQAAGLAARGRYRVVRLADGSEVAARGVIIATGVAWRRLGVPGPGGPGRRGCVLRRRQRGGARHRGPGRVCGRRR